MDKNTPEQREQMRLFRERMRAGGGPGGPGGPGGGFGGGGFGGAGGGMAQSRPSDGPQIKTIYRLDTAKSTPEKSVLEAVVVKLGVNDGGNSEVLDGLNPGDVVIVGTEFADSNSAQGRPGGPGGGFGNPFGGPGGFRPR